VVPVPGRDLFVQAWYQGGISIMDFTDSARPVEIAYFDRGPIDAEELSTGGFWSAYWYRGRIYGTEIIRGLDVLALTPSEHLSANEIAAAALADQGGVFNPQQQFPVSWPAEPVVAQAYLDQMRRTGALPESLDHRLNRALEQSERILRAGGKDSGVAASLQALAAELAGLQIADGADDAAMQKRWVALGDTLGGIAARL
jgi:hypothetical protein